MVLLSLPCCISILVLLKVFYPKKKKKGKLVNRTKLRFDMKKILDLHPKKKKKHLNSAKPMVSTVLLFKPTSLSFNLNFSLWALSLLL